MRIHYLTLDQMIVVIERTLGPPAQAHLRDVGLLEGAVARPAAGMMGAETYPDLYVKAAALMHSVVTSHPLVDGNKRVGLAAALVLLAVNGVKVAPAEALFDLTMAVASGKIRDVHAIAEVLRRLP